MHKKTITTVLDEKRQGVRICIILIMIFNTEREKETEREVYIVGQETILFVNF